MQYEMRTGLFWPFFPRYFHKAQTNDHLQLLRPQVECALRASKLEDIVEKNLLSCFSYSTADFRPGIVPRHIKIQLRPKKTIWCLPSPFLGPSQVPFGSILGPSWVPLSFLSGPCFVPTQVIFESLCGFSSPSLFPQRSLS